MEKSDYLVMGAGIIGISVARELARRKVGRVILLEKETTFGKHASGRNSGVIHSGINQNPGSLKARMCVEGNRRLREYCRQSGVPMTECGTLVMARSQQEVQILETLLDMGKQCGVEGLRMLNREELRQREPFAKGIAALLSPNGAAVDSEKLMEHLGRETRELGAECFFGEEVIQIEGPEVRTGKSRFQTDYVVNCAGVNADRLAWMMGAGRSYRVIPFRGEYMEVKNCDVRSMIYQPPDLRFPFLSIHLTRETDGRVLAGPSAVPAFGREAYDKEWKWGEMLEMFSSRQFLRLILNPEFLRLAFENAATSLFKRAFVKQVQTLVEGLEESQFFPARAGIRAQMVDDKGRFVNDLLIEKQDRALHVLNSISPGMTCSLAFADYLVDQILRK